jgi:predicted P-loop ATPase
VEVETVQEEDFDNGFLGIKAGDITKHNEIRFNPHPDWDNLANILFGTDDPLSQTMFTLFLINCCKRAFNPGCIQKRVLILKSDQDDGKSAFCSTLALGWGTELQHGTKETDMPYLFQNTWIMELGECDKHFKTKDASTWKNLISTRVDKYIAKWETEATESPRVTCFIGTTNQDRFLTDPTGNKRYWIVEIAEGHKLPLQWLQDNIDHIWATAYRFYKEGVYTDLSDEQKLESEARNREYMIEGSFVEQLQRVLEVATKDGAKNIAFKVIDVQMALGTHTDNQPKTKAAVINSLKQLGYVEKPLWINGKTERLYRLSTGDKPVKAKYERGAWVYWSDKLNDWQLPHDTAIEDRKKDRGQA